MHPCIYKLHEKYGHASLDKLKRMAIVGELDGEDKGTRVEVNLAKGRIDCHHCDAGKNAKKRGEKQSGRGKRVYLPWELVSMDHSGPYPIMFGGYRYFSLFVDHGSDLIVVDQAYTCTSNETTQGMQTLHELVRTQTNKNIKGMRSDKGSDYTSSEAREWASKVGVVLETVPPMDMVSWIGRRRRLVFSIAPHAHS